MRRLWATVLLAVLCTTVGAYVLLVELPRRHRQRLLERPFNFRPLEVQELALRVGKTSLRLRRVEGVWRLVEPLNDRADEDEVAGMLYSLSHLRVRRRLKHPGKLADYGLNPPQGIVRLCLRGERTLELRLGTEAPVGYALYAQLGRNPEVVLVDLGVEDLLRKTTFDLRDKRLFRFVRSQVKELRISSPRGRLLLTRSPSGWRLADLSEPRPERRYLEADPQEVEGLLLYLEELRVKRFVAEEAKELSSYGLQPPRVSLELDLQGERLQRLGLGRQAKDGVYATGTEPGRVVLVEAEAVKRLSPSAFDLRERHLLRFEPWRVTELRMRRLKGQWKRWRRTSKGWPSARIEDFIYDLRDLRYQERLEHPGKLADYGLALPELEAVVMVEGKPVGHILLGRRGNWAYAKLPGRKGVYRVKPEILKTAPR